MNDFVKLVSHVWQELQYYKKTESPFRVVLLEQEVIWPVNMTINCGDDFDPAYILLLTGCDCFLSGKIQNFELFSFLICLPLHINPVCKYSTFESYVWIVLY